MVKEEDIEFWIDPEMDTIWHRWVVGFIILFLSTGAFYLLKLKWIDEMYNTTIFIGLMSISLICYHTYAKTDIGICRECLRSTTISEVAKIHVDDIED